MFSCQICIFVFISRVKNTLTYGQTLYYYSCILHYACQFKNKIKLKSKNVQLSNMHFCIYIYSEKRTTSII